MLRYLTGEKHPYYNITESEITSLGSEYVPPEVSISRFAEYLPSIFRLFPIRKNLLKFSLMNHWYVKNAHSLKTFKYDGANKEVLEAIAANQSIKSLEISFG